MAVKVLSSAKLCKSDFSMHRNKSLRNISKMIGPYIEPCGTPDKIFWNALKMLFILIFCFRSFKYEFRKVTVSKLSPYAWSLETRKSCGIQSNVLDKSIKTAPVKRFLSSNFQ